MLIQCLWRCYAADKSFNSEATWLIHVKDGESTSINANNSLNAVLPTQLGKVRQIIIKFKVSFKVVVCYA